MRTSIYLSSMSHSTPVPTAATIGNILVSGLLTGRDPVTGELPCGLVEQCRNMFLHMDAVMKASGGTTGNILKVTLWMNDRNQRGEIDELWVAAFPDPESRPARTALNRDLGNGKLVECEIMAVLP